MARNERLASSASFLQMSFKRPTVVMSLSIASSAVATLPSKNSTSGGIEVTEALCLGSMPEH